MKTDAYRIVLKAALGLIMVPWLAHAETTICSNAENEIRNSSQTTPSDRFLLPTTGGDPVVDKSTGLMWDRCSVGFVYDGTRLEGCVADANATVGFTWSDALLKAQALNSTSYRGYNNWRVPTYKELNTIVERSCKYPSANWQVFPNTKNGPYWTSTPVPLIGSSPSYRAFVVNFIDMHLGDAIPHLSIEGRDVLIADQPLLANNKYGAWLRLVRTCDFNNDAGECR